MSLYPLTRPPPPPRIGRPPQNPRSYITRHLRIRRALDRALQIAAKEERRGFNNLVHVIFEDWLAARRTPRQTR